MASDSIFLIDIDKILRDKAGRKAKRIPRFFVSYLKHIVHQEEINTFLKSVTDKSGVDFLAACMDFLDAKLDVHGLEICLKMDCVPLYQIIRWEDRMELH